MSMLRRLLSVALSLFPLLLAAAEPQVLDPRLELTLVAEHPDIVTPIGIAFDHQQRLLVAECHTHFPPEGYAGPKTDRIRLAEDTDGDGKLDRWRTFYEGSHATMSLRRGPAPWIYVATRMEVFRICDRDGDDVAETVERLAHLETRGNYPHNGLCGLAFDSEGNLYFGLGENLGEPYKLIGSDHRTLSGGGEGGNIYRCAPDGSQLTQIATGFWNPFGICVDPEGRVFTVGNDPDASPPCRLLHVVPGGDYGYQFRYGRSGRHPLQAWNGELPGTLPMVAGTGEAPCTVLPYDGKLWVSSWGDYRIERFSLQPQGGSFFSSSETVVQGDQEFRPVDFAVAENGDLYFTDWVDKSYPVHGRGRIWRLRWRDGHSPDNRWPALTPAEVHASHLRQQADLAELENADPFLHQAAVWGCLQHNALPEQWEAAATPAQRRAMLEAARWRLLHGTVPPAEWLVRALQDNDVNVRLLAVRLIADAGLKPLRPQLEKQLEDRVVSPRLFQATLATLEWLDTSSVPRVKDPSYDEYLLQALRAPGTSPAIRAMALRLISADHAQLSLDQLVTFTQHENEDVRREALRTLVMRRQPERNDVLARIATDGQWPVGLRADAVAGLAGVSGSIAAQLEQLAAAAGDSVLGREARRALRERESATPQAVTPSMIDQILTQLDDTGDPAAGWRLFFGSHGARCSSCHRFEGRGSSIGPDLTTAGSKLTRRRLLESLLDPSREIAPQFVPWILELNDGRVLTGLSQGKSTDGLVEEFVDAKGDRFQIQLAEIASRRASTASIMPTGLLSSLTREELNDLVALLTNSAASE